jgi:hypothetical protein
VLLGPTQQLAPMVPLLDHWLCPMTCPCLEESCLVC